MLLTFAFITCVVCRVIIDVLYDLLSIDPLDLDNAGRAAFVPTRDEPHQPVLLSDPAYHPESGR